MTVRPKTIMPKSCVLVLVRGGIVVMRSFFVPFTTVLILKQVYPMHAISIHHKYTVVFVEYGRKFLYLIARVFCKKTWPVLGLSNME